MRLLVQFNLEAAGFHVTLAGTGTEGLAAVAAEEPDLVLLDVMLPDMGGFEVARQLTDVPVVFMSARAARDRLLARTRNRRNRLHLEAVRSGGVTGRLREDLIELDRGGSAAHVWTLRFGPTP